VVEVRMPTEQQLADAERQYAWRTESVAKLEAQRADRRRGLETQEEAIRRALEAYRGLPAPYRMIRLREDFVALRDPRPLSPALGGPEPEQPLSRSAALREDYRTRPPSTKLLMRKTHALCSYLAMIYVAHAEPQATKVIRANASRTGRAESWAVLCGRWAPTVRARRARMARDLQELLRADLVSIGPLGAQGRYEKFRLLADDTTDQIYKAPRRHSRQPSVLTLPSTFFTNGWHLVLSPAEIAVLLMARHATQTLPISPDEPGVGLPRSMRWSVYGISGEAYEAIHGLDEFGLIAVHDTMPHRRHGKLRLLPPERHAALEADGESIGPVPYRLEIQPDTAFDRSALPTVHRSLLDNPTPPRLSAG
jgi:hypothetical protein